MTSEVQIFGKDKIKLNILQDILGGMIKVGFQLNNGPVQDYVTEIHTDGKRVNVFGKFNISEDANEGDTITIRPIMIDTPLKLTFQSNAIFSGKKASIVRNATKMVDQEFEISSETMAIELVPQGKQCYLLKVTNGAGIAAVPVQNTVPVRQNKNAPKVNPTPAPKMDRSKPDTQFEEIHPTQPPSPVDDRFAGFELDTGITEEGHHLIELLMEYKYNTRTENFGNAGDVKKLVIDMKKLLLKRTSKAAEGVDRYQYTAEDIPADQLDLIKDQINPRTFDDIMKDLNEQIGLSDLKEIILQKQEQLLYAKKSGKSSYGINPGYYFFVGNPGTGKSTSAKLFGECLRELGIVKTNNFYSCTAKDLIGQYMGETDKKTYELLKKSINGVLFIDEAYSLSYAESAHSDSSYKKEALEQIIAFMDDPEHRKRCCIILAGYEKDMQGLYKSNSGMRSRIEEVHFRDYSPTEMYQIFALFCRKAGYAIADGVEEYYTPIFKNMSTMEYFSNGRTARTIYEKTAANLMRRVVRTEGLTEEEQKTIQMSDLLSEDECYSIVSVE